MCNTKNYNNLLALVIGAFIGLLVFGVTYLALGSIFQPFIITAVFAGISVALFLLLSLIAGCCVNRGQRCGYDRSLYNYTKNTLTLFVIGIIFLFIVLIVIGLLPLLLSTVFLALSAFVFTTLLSAYVLWIIYIIKYKNTDCICNE